MNDNISLSNMSIEEFAAFLDGNLSEEDMDAAADRIALSPKLQDIYDASCEVDAMLDNAEYDGLEMFNDTSTDNIEPWTIDVDDELENIRNVAAADYDLHINAEGDLWGYMDTTQDNTIDDGCTNDNINI